MGYSCQGFTFSGPQYSTLLKKKNATVFTDRGHVATVITEKIKYEPWSQVKDTYPRVHMPKTLQFILLLGFYNLGFFLIAETTAGWQLINTVQFTQYTISKAHLNIFEHWYCSLELQSIAANHEMKYGNYIFLQLFGPAFPACSLCIHSLCCASVLVLLKWMRELHLLMLHYSWSVHVLGGKEWNSCSWNLCHYPTASVSVGCRLRNWRPGGWGKWSYHSL